MFPLPNGAKNLELKHPEARPMALSPTQFLTSLDSSRAPCGLSSALDPRQGSGGSPLLFPSRRTSTGPLFLSTRRAQHAPPQSGLDAEERHLLSLGIQSYRTSGTAPGPDNGTHPSPTVPEVLIRWKKNETSRWASSRVKFRMLWGLFHGTRS